jgi:hypothetical protein
MNSNYDAKVNGVGDNTAKRLRVTANGCTAEQNELHFSVSLCLCGERGYR